MVCSRWLNYTRTSASWQRHLPTDLAGMSHLTITLPNRTDSVVSGLTIARGLCLPHFRSSCPTVHEDYHRSHDQCCRGRNGSHSYMAGCNRRLYAICPRTPPSDGYPRKVSVCSIPVLRSSTMAHCSTRTQCLRSSAL
jgi:hypothetical protein